MAKRKRLTPARNLTQHPSSQGETVRPALTGMRAPIADVAHDAAATAALAEVADARHAGRLVLELPLDQIDLHYLVRDRFIGDLEDDDMATLIASLKERGQQTPIEVTPQNEDGLYGLISGWRRLHALFEIQKENPAVDTVLALVRRPDDLADAYQAMVEENEIRSNLSNYERASIVVRARKAGVFNSTKGALNRLFGTASRSKRSKINSFVTVADAIGGALRFPKVIPERLGLALAQAIDADADFGPRRYDRLLAAQCETAAAESQVIQGALRDTKPPAPPAPKPERHVIRDGLTMTIHPEGRVVLEGARMTEPDMIKNLRRALSTL